MNFYLLVYVYSYRYRENIVIIRKMISPSDWNWIETKTTVCLSVCLYVPSVDTRTFDEVWETKFCGCVSYIKIESKTLVLMKIYQFVSIVQLCKDILNKMHFCLNWIHWNVFKVRILITNRLDVSPNFRKFLKTFEFHDVSFYYFNLI